LLYDKGIDMNTVTVSPKFQIVIPKDVRTDMKLQSGAKLAVFKLGGAIQLVPVPTLAELQAKLKGIDTSIVDDPDRF
jgi:AbrB family looped-hinge helix DNA binding protein